MVEFYLLLNSIMVLFTNAATDTTFTLCNYINSVVVIFSLQTNYEALLLGVVANQMTVQ